MAKRTRYSEYQNGYANYKFELTDDGILFMQCHTNGDSLVWSWKAHDERVSTLAFAPDGKALASGGLVSKNVTGCQTLIGV